LNHFINFILKKACQAEPGMNGINRAITKMISIYKKYDIKVHCNVIFKFYFNNNSSNNNK